MYFERHHFVISLLTCAKQLRGHLGSRSFADIARGLERMGENSEMPITRVLFCGPYFPASQKYTREYLQKYPFIQVDDVPLSDVPKVLSDYHVCVFKNMHLDSSIIAQAKQMKLIVQFGVGLEGVDIDAATKNGIKVARIPGDLTGNAASCAEMAIYLMLGLLRKQNEMQVSVKQRRLGDPIGDALFGQTVFIMGFGNIGVELAKRLRGFDVKIIATKRSWGLHSQAPLQSYGMPIQNGVSEILVDEKGSHEDSLEFAAKADIVVCCLTMNKETVRCQTCPSILWKEGIVDKSFISSMKKGALLVNIARGRLLDYEAVLHNLKSGHLGGFGIDAAWTKPFDPNDPILTFDNVLLTPHVAGITEPAYRYMAKVVGDVALQVHSGNSLTGIEIVN